MAIDAYMVFTPPKAMKHPIEIKGETSDQSAKITNAFEITEFSWGASSEEGQSQDNLNRRVIEVEEFKITKPIDSASPYLFLACVTEGCFFAEAKIFFRKMNDKGQPYIYLQFIFKEVRVDKVEWKLQAVEGSEPKPDEQDVDFRFAKFDLFYTPQADLGTMKTESKKTASWSLPP